MNTPSNSQSERPAQKPPLAALAEAAGVDTGYWTIDGVHHEAPETTLLEILSILGLSAETPEQMATSLEKIQRRPWETLLPPVLVIYEDQVPFSIPICMAPDHNNPMIFWKLALENGHQTESGFHYHDLPLDGALEQEGFFREKRLFHIHDRLPIGYHRFELRFDNAPPDSGQTLSLIVAPRHCYHPPAFQNPEWKGWGLAVQLYGLWHARDQLMGNFSDLLQLVHAAGQHGASAIGLNPLHAPLAQIPERHSPYAPSSRLFLSPLYIDVTRVPEFGDASVQRLIETLGHRPDQANPGESLVDYPAVSRWQWHVLESMFSVFILWNPGARQWDVPSEDPRVASFQRFRKEHGEVLCQSTLFEALSEHFAQHPDHGAIPSRWPEAYQNPRSEACQHFAQGHGDRLLFHAFCYWLAEEQMAECSQACHERGFAVGLYNDIALGVDPDGADFWRMRAAFAQTMRLGAPPDAFSPRGQNWGLPPLHPLLLEDSGYAPFIELLRANMRQAGAIRLDHVMALTRLFWIPLGAESDRGTYVNYPFEALLAIVALESHRNQCLVIGEALGTVPEGFRERLAEAGVLSYQLLFFSQTDQGAPLPPEYYPKNSAVSASTHDLPTLRGWWNRRDLELRRALDLFPTREMEEMEHKERQRFRKALLEAYQKASLNTGSLNAEPGQEQYAPEFIRATYDWLAKSPGRLLMVQFEDLLEQLEAANLPGTVDQHPNWRRRLSQPTDRLCEHPLSRQVIESMHRHQR